MQERITIKDIARELNIHHSTVSRALRNDPRVKDKTRKTVMDYANEYGYQINMSALELRGEKRKTIAVIVPNISHHFFSNVVSNFTDFASSKGYVVSVFQTNESVEREISIIDTIIQNNFSGVIASISMESKNTDHFKKLTDRNIPLVMYDRVGSIKNVSTVTINNSDIVYEAVNILLNKGYKKIAHISGPEHLNVFNERQLGYKKAMADAGINYHKTVRFNTGFTIEDGMNTAKELLDSDNKPDAIISDSSNSLYGIIKEINKRRLKIPDDLAIIVFGENPSLEVMNPPITSIVQPCKDIADVIFELIESDIENSSSKIRKNITLEAEIIIRDSI